MFPLIKILDIEELDIDLVVGGAAGGVQIRIKSEAVRFQSDLCPKTTASAAV